MIQQPLANFGITLEQKIVDGIQLLQVFEPKDGYYLCFSGGKDSVVVKDIATRSGVKFTSNYSVTTIDPPELTRFIRHHHQDTIWHRPKVPLLRMVEKKGLPSRRIRWCCEKYKEQGGAGRVKIMGIRSAESPRRAARWEPVTEWRPPGGALVINPILSFTDAEVWRYIRMNNLPYCSLYDEGRTRIGCIGCPMSKIKKDFQRWPHMERLWRKAAQKRWSNLTAESRSLRTFRNGDEWFDWWTSDCSLPKENECQMGLF